MNMVLSVVLVVLSLAILYFGADFLVKGSSSMAVRAGISPLVVGLTVVALGTSAPELVVSIKSALEGIGSIAVGNVIGSNIFNICVILGISAMICPLQVDRRLIRIDTPIMLIASLLLCCCLAMGISGDSLGSCFWWGLRDICYFAYIRLKKERLSKGNRR